MGRKNARARQARLQRKRSKRAASRSRRQGGAAPDFSPPPQEILATGVILCCQGLLAGAPLTGEMLGMARLAQDEIGGALGHIAQDLRAFLFEGQPWGLTCAELAPLRRVFDKHGADDVFERLWSLALTCEPGSAFDDTVDEQECAHRAASAFEQLRGCLDDRKRSAAVALRLITQEAGRHGASARLRKGYEKLLRNALAAVHASAGKLPGQLAKLGVEVPEVFEVAQQEDTGEAWWACGRVFLQEVLRRLQERPGVAGTSGYTALVSRLLTAPQAAVELARSGQPEPLSSVHLAGQAGEWSAFLERALDVGALPFEGRVRYQIARLKLLRAKAMTARDDEEPVGQLLATFQALQNLLAHGVPPQARDIPTALAAPLQDFYVEMIEALRCEAQALRVTEEQLRQHRQDFRLGCLYATGALQRGEHYRLAYLATCSPVRHVVPELFAYSVRLWSRAPRGAKAASTLRERLFDPLDREDRKQCLIALSKQCLRRAAGLREYETELGEVLPYFPRDSFVLAELREQAALESSLVFLATMMAPLHTTKLTLTDEQSQQWVSYVREIARQSRLGSQIALRYLTSPSKWFTLAPAVLGSAREQLADFKPRSESAVAPRPPVPKPPAKRRRRKKKEASSAQQELFDGLDP